ncbi:ribonuclease H-like domain-containing protein [Tanacetum coccineum]
MEGPKKRPLVALLAPMESPKPLLAPMEGPKQHKYWSDEMIKVLLDKCIKEIKSTVGMTLACISSLGLEIGVSASVSAASAFGPSASGALASRASAIGERVRALNMDNDPDFRRRRALNSKEKFNHSHAKLRNMIERAYGVLKAHFPILKRMAPFSLTTQRNIMIACFVLHNFIRKEGLDDELFSTYDQSNVQLDNENVLVEEDGEFGDSYKVPPEEPGKAVAGEASTKKKGRTMAITTEDMQKRRNDVKARNTLLWEAILKTFGGNEATKKTKKNQLKQQYGNFKAEGSETLEQTFNRLQAIASHLEFMDVPIEKDDLNQKFLTIYEPKVQKKEESNSQNMAFISSSNTSSGKGEVPTASVPTLSSQIKWFLQSNKEDITQDCEGRYRNMVIKRNLALLSKLEADRF